MIQPTSRIVITGFMGAGKTTVAFALAEQSGRHAIDLDAFIVERESHTIHELIDHEGETRFREIETSALSEVLETNSWQIIALGGGAWTLPRNRTLIKQHNCVTAWLDAPFELCWQRITKGNDVRPFARSQEQAHRVYEERRAIYQLADLHIEVSEETSAAELAARVAEAWVAGSSL